MGLMKDFLITIHNGGDEAVAAVQRMGDDWRLQLEQASSELERQWIPVTERLPEAESRCLIWEQVPNPDAAMEFASWLGDRWKTHGAIGAILHPSMVSHWMPLPAPPTASK